MHPDIAPSRPHRTLAAFLVCLAALAAFVPAGAECALPPDDVCPSVCSYCLTETVSCEFWTGCGAGECPPGYEQVASCTLTCGCLFDQSELCRRTGPRTTDECGGCAPGRFGADCTGECPPSASDPCHGHGTCDDGLSGDGSCACDTGYDGPECDRCAPDHYDYPACAYCDAFDTCGGRGVCAADGQCICDEGFTGPGCVPCETGAAEIDCDDGVDNDCDGLGDCDDDDCCTSPQCAGDDMDADTYAVCDCDDTDGGVWAPPGEVTGLRLSHDHASGTFLEWDAPHDPGGLSWTYETLRYGSTAAMGGVAHCLALEHSDPDQPETDAVFFYLVRANNGCPGEGGDLGASSSGERRSGSCP